MAKILLVDDEAEIVFLTKKVLTEDGHDVSVAVSGAQCLEILETELPDLILLDIMMSGINGWEIGKSIKNNPRTKDIPVVTFTVRSSKDSVEKSLNYSKATAQINKPFKIDELLTIVNTVLKDSKA